MNDRRGVIPAIGLLFVVATPFLVWLAWNKLSCFEAERALAGSLIRLLMLFAFAMIAAAINPEGDDPAVMLTFLAIFPGLLVPCFVALAAEGSALVRASIIAETILFLYGLALVIAAMQQLESPGAQRPATHGRANQDAERERDELLKELQAVAEDKDSPLDPVTVEAQRQEIEANYQRKRVDAEPANMGGHR